MKKITMFLLIMAFSVQIISAKNVSEVINEFRDDSKAEYTYVSPAMMLLARATVKQYSKETGDLLNKVNCVRILNLNACKSKTKKKLFKEIEKLDEEEYQLVMTKAQKKNGLEVLVKVAVDGTSEFVFLNSDQENCLLIQVEGKITMEEIQKMIDGKQLPGMS